MGEWKEFKLGDLVTLEYGKSLKGYKDGLGAYCFVKIKYSDRVSVILVWHLLL